MENKDKEKNIDEKKKNAAIIIGIIAGIIVFVIFFVTSYNVSNKDKENSSLTEYNYNIGQTAKYDGLEISITDFSYKSFFCGISVSSSTDNTLCVVDVKLKNTTSKAIKLYDQLLTYTSYKYNYTLIYNNSIEYNETWTEFADFINTHEEIKPLETITASLCYKIPNEVKNSSKKLELSFSLNKTDAPEFHIWTLR